MPAKPKAQNKSKETTVQAALYDPALSGKTQVNRLMWLLFAIAFILFFNTLAHGFVLDDIAVIEKNTFVQQGFAGIPKLFSTFYWEGYWDSNAGLYRPLSLVMFAAEWSISPENPFIHHFVNVLLYGISIALVFRLLVRILPAYSVWIPFFTTLLFAVHPIHSEVVANIKSRDELLCFLFFVLTFSYILRSGLAGIRPKITAAFLFLLCLLSKEAGMLFLPVIGLWLLLFEKERFAVVVKKLLPLIIVSILWLVLHQSVINSSSERITYSYHDNSLVMCEGASQAATGIAILGRYLLNAVLPLKMSYDYSYNQIPCETFASPVVLVTLAIAVLLIFAAIRLRKSNPAVSFGILFFFITIVPVSNVFTLIGTTMGDRLLFTPVLGICIAFVYGISALFKKESPVKLNRIAVISFSVVSLAAFAGAFNRNKAWESNATLFTADVENSPNSARTHFNYGVTLMDALPQDVERQEDGLPDVIAAFSKAIAIDPKDAGSHINLGVCYYRLKDYKKAILHTRKGVELNDDHTAYNNLADAYYKDNNADSAIVYYRKTIAAGLATATTYNLYGVVHFNRADYPEAITVYKEGLQKFPSNEDLMMNLGSSYGLTKQYKEAIAVFQEVVKQNPNNKKAYYFLALTYQSLGDAPNTEKYLLLSK